ncbi:hypothetical protein [Methanocaldococcus sp.]|uniref:hypothetical protein n=1 Tax=Methanocaldococcus sp. TaxID=2152917 RepID=UPI0026361EF1|nr:hypothetical protein [Methanocaldococcus sp.]MCQ6254555.1 hypothetical protein [Methanocaldococcus sp.]
MSNKEKEFEKRKILYDTIFDLYKLFLGAGLTLLVAIVVKVAFSEGKSYKWFRISASYWTLYI